ncbi:MAG: inositol monophosphatase, partial [Rhodobacteraceae bacterium]|nr:inositol monophosphatase [Paracoccaceae bacterium]
KVFIVDPIDGTRAFIDGSPTWAHSLAVSELGQITAAIVYLPEHDKMYSAGRDLGAFLNGAPLKASPINMVEGATLLAAKPTFDAWNWQDGQVPPVTRKFRSSLAYRMSLVGEGRFDAMATLRATWEWDVAAGTLIVEEAGGRVTDRRQNPLMFNNKGAQVNGVVAGGKIIQTALATRLSQA